MKSVERIIQFIDNQNINKSRFYKETGLSNGYLDKVKDIGSEKLEIILSFFPELNIEWVVTGKGSMFKSENLSKADSNVVAELEKRIKEQSMLIDLLQEKLKTTEARQSPVRPTVKS